MNGDRSLHVLLVVFFALMVILSTSVQAAEIEEQVSLRGPETGMFLCDGPVVGQSTIKTSSKSLAEKIVGGVLRKEKDEGDVLVSVRFRNGPEDTTFNVFWRGLAVAGQCDSAQDFFDLGEITTDNRGRARERYRLPDGNPFPGEGVVIAVCDSSGGPGTCSAPVWTALFDVVFPDFP